MTAGLTWIMTTKADYLPSLYRHVTDLVFAKQISAWERSAPLRSVNVTCPLGQWP
jgi:hypothetical protein